MRKYLLILFAFVLIGCAGLPLQKALEPNRTSLLKLSVGISKEDTLKIMGTKSISTYSQGNALGIPSYLTINNPYKSEILQGDGKTYQVLYYVTDVKNDDNAISDNELTPLVFDNDRLIGWGWSFLQSKK